MKSFPEMIECEMKIVVVKSPPFLAPLLRRIFIIGKKT